jgi:flagellar biosynthesis protein FlhA
VIVSVAAALLLSKGREEGAIDLALGKQLAGNATPLFIVAGILAVFAVLPGLPFLPFMVAAASFAGLAFLLTKKAEKDKKTEEADTCAQAAPPKVAKIGDSIYADEIHLEVAPDLVNMVLVGENGFESRVDKIRRYIAEEYGFVLPPIRMTDNPTLKKNEYRIRIQGVRIDSGTCARQRPCPDRRQPAAPPAGEKVREPVYKAAARWLPNGKKQELTAAGIPVVEPMEVLATHMLEVIQSNFSLVFTRMVMVETLEALTRIPIQTAPGPTSASSTSTSPARSRRKSCCRCCACCSTERISIRNLFLIIETIAEVKAQNLALPRIVELVRQRLAFQIVDRLQDDQGRLPLVQLSANWEQKFSEYEVKWGRRQLGYRAAAGSCSVS